MKLEGAGKLLRIFVGESDRRGAQPLYTAIVERARHEGLSGATVFKGIEGYGSHGRLHSLRTYDFSTNLPVLIEVAESEEKVRTVIPRLREMIAEGLITLERIRMRLVAPVPGPG